MKRILIVDDHEVVRDGVKRMLSEQEPFEFGDAASVGEALTMLHESTWDLVILDILPGDRSGLEVLKEAKHAEVDLPVLVLNDVRVLEQYVVRAWKRGAAGFVTKQGSRDELVTAVNRVMNGERYVCAAVSEMLAGVERDDDRPAHSILSDREFEVLRLIGAGKTVTEIAGLLGVSDKSISTYRTRLLRKMRLKNNAELARYAIQNKLVD